MKLSLGPKDILFPVPAALVVSGTGKQANIITVAWIGVAGSDPPAIGISLKESRYSLELIRAAGEFSVNIPSSEHFRETDYCGIVSGRKRDKFADTGFTPVPGLKIGSPVIKECPLNIECRVMTEVPVGKWILIIGEILETRIDADKACGPGIIDIPGTDPLAYCATVREYYTLGKKLGNGFSAGKEIKDRLKA